MNKPGKNPFMRIILCMILLLLSQTVVAFAVVLLNGGSLFSGDLSMAQADAAMLEIMYAHQTQILLISYFVVLLVLWLMARKNQQSLFAFTGLDQKVGLPVVLLAFIAGIAAAFWATIAVNLAPWPQAWTETYQTESAALQSAWPAIDFLAVVVFAPLVEELLFRGVIYQAFCAMLPAGLAVVFQAILFGSVHSTIIWMTYACFMGCLLGYVRKHTGSTRPCILMHMAFNLSSYLFAWFAEQYGEDPAAVVLTFVVSAVVLLLTVYGINYRTDKPSESK